MNFNVKVYLTITPYSLKNIFQLIFMRNYFCKRGNIIKIQTNPKWLFSVRISLFTSVILLSYSLAQAQEKEIKLNITIPNSFKNYKNLPAQNFRDTEELSVKEVKHIQTVHALESEREKAPFALVEAENETSVKENDLDETDIKDVLIEKNLYKIEDKEKLGWQPAKEKEKFHWKFALIESGVFLGFQHGFRMIQKKTTRELGGPFFRDWAQLVKNLRGWKDGDNLFTNYIAHPGQGAITGRIFINNSDRSKEQEFGKSKKYWESRFKAMTWSAVWSTQFELGPISEATIGNVGLCQKNGHSTMAYVDLVMTPVAGTGLVVAEDAVDKFFLKNWLEKKTSNKFVIKISRSLFTPTTSIANMLRWQMPWRLDNRRL